MTLAIFLHSFLHFYHLLSSERGKEGIPPEDLTLVDMRSTFFSSPKCGAPQVQIRQIGLSRLSHLLTSALPQPQLT